MYTRDHLASDLRRLGLTPGATVMVHASLRSIGPVEGGAIAVIGAIMDVVGKEGTMLMVLGARDDLAWINDRPEEERAALLAGAEPFDALTTPADPEVGYLAEAFRLQPSTQVSDHPEGRFAAAGAGALRMVADVPWDDYFGAGSPLERLIEADGLILRIGADPDTTTAFHHAEYLADVPDKRRVRRHRLVSTSSGPQIRVVETLDDTEGIVEWPGDDYFVTILEAYLATGRALTGAVGDAPSQLLDAGDAVAFAAAWMNANLS